MKVVAIVIFLFVLWPLQGNSQIITTIVGDSIAAYAGDGGYAIFAKLNTPAQIIFDKHGNLYIDDKGNHVIRKVNTSGIITTIAGNGTPGFSGDGGLAISAQLHTPTSIAVDSIGNLYISDGANYRIRKVNTSGVITTIAGTGMIGSAGDNYPATDAKISPYAVAVDNSGNIFFSEGGYNRIRKISTSGIITTIAGNGTVGFSGDGGPATNAQFHTPGYLAVNSSGDIYVPDWMNSRVRKISAGGIITTVAGNGTVGNTGDGGDALLAELNAPNAINFDNEGNFYISDNFAYVVRKVNSAGIVTTIAGNGTMGFSGDGGLATNAQFNRPNTVVFDTLKNAYIVDALNNRIRKISFNTTGLNFANSIAPNISIFPCPASSMLDITMGEQIKKIDILSTVGQTLFTQIKEDYSKHTQIDIANLPPGFYLLRLNDLYVKSFIKN